MTTQTFSYTGSAQTFTVPADVSTIDVSVCGAQGGDGFYNPSSVTVAGGQGCTVTATIGVTPAEVLQINVGGKPPLSGAVFGGGGTGATDGTSRGGAGGGASDIRQGGTTLANRIVVAGGGGGSADNASVVGGTGGTNGATGGGSNGGGGGTQSAGGAGGTAGTSTVGSAGGLGVGGNSGTGSGTLRPGGGGGGYYGGGGGGGTNTGAGGGGSSFGGTASTGGITGHGSVVLNYTAAVAPPAPSVGNYRNATGTQSPPLFTSMDGTVQFGVSIDGDYSLTALQRDTRSGAQTTNDMNANSAAISSGLVPLNATEDANSVHYGYAGARDDRDRNYIVGNSLASTPHMVRSAANSITSWTNIPWPYPGITSTGGGTTYQIFNRLSTGELILHLDQREAGGGPRGKDNYAYLLPLGSDTWQPLIGSVSGSVAGTFVQASNSTAPDRAYVTGCFVEYRPHLDRVWVAGLWRDDWTQVTTQRRPWLIYNDTVTNPGTWKTYAGATQAMPVTAANCAVGGFPNETGATIPQTHGTYCPYQSGQLVVDWNGWPHILLKEDSTTNTWHYWWDGSTWSSEKCATSSYPNIALKPDGAVTMYREFANRIQYDPPTGTAYNFIKCGNTVPGNYDFPFADPIQQQRFGYTHLLVPDAADQPEVCTFGDATGRPIAYSSS